MPAPRKTIAAGNKYAFLGFLDSRYLLGGDTSAPASGAAGSGMIRLDGIREVPTTLPEPELVQITGDDGLVGEFEFEATGSRAFVATLAVRNRDLEAKLLGVSVEVIGEIRFMPFDFSETPELDCCLIAQSRAKKQDAGARGAKAWEGKIINRATVRALGRDSFNERAGAMYRLYITPQLAAYPPWGTTLLDAVNGIDAARVMEFTSEYPVTIHRHTGNGVLTTFNLDYEPVSAVKTAARAAGNPATVNSVSAAAKTMTLSGAAADGAALTTVYEFNG